MRIHKAFAAASVLMLSAPVWAQPIDSDPRWQQPSYEPRYDAAGPRDVEPGTANYAGLRGSYAFNANNVTTYAPPAPFGELRASYASGGGASVYVGTHLPLNLRLELEAMFRYQPLSRLSLNGIGVAATGDTRVAAPMVNLLWDIPMPEDIGIQPFVGMGIGAAYSKTSLTSPGNIFTSQNRWDLAYSFMSGFALPLDQTSRLTAMYRFMQVRDAGHKCATAGLVQSVCLDSSVNTSSVDLGYEMDL